MTSRSYRKSPQSKVYFITCKCDCGTDREFRYESVASGYTKSCGCLRKDNASIVGRNNATHGMGSTHEYRAWRGIFNRVNGSDWHYSGMTVDLDWHGAGGFIEFYTEMGPAPSPQHTVDRIDNELGYISGNVRWATISEQARNRKSNVHIQAFGKEMCLVEWSLETGILPETISRRIKSGWSVEDSLTISPDRRNRPHREPGR